MKGRIQWPDVAGDMADGRRERRERGVGEDAGNWPRRGERQGAAAVSDWAMETAPTRRGTHRKICCSRQHQCQLQA